MKQTHVGVTKTGKPAMQEKALERFLTGLSDEATDRDGRFLESLSGPQNQLYIYIFCFLVILFYHSFHQFFGYDLK